MKRLLVFLVVLLMLFGFVLHVPFLKAEEMSSTESQAARLEILRSAFPINLTDKEKTDTIQRCQSAQINIQAIANRLDTIETSRNATYDDIALQLLNVQRRLLNQQIDTSELDLLVASYAKSRITYTDALNNYRTTLVDAATMNCQSDPETFRSAVEGLRAARKKVVDQVNGLRELVHSDVKTTFDTTRDRLKSSGAN